MVLRLTMLLEFSCPMVLINHLSSNMGSHKGLLVQSLGQFILNAVQKPTIELMMESSITPHKL
jgi:hypothetical protein